MGNNKFDRIKKTIAILLLLCFVLSVTVASVSAADNSESGKNKDGYKAGYNKGYKDGKKQGQKDCDQYGIREILQKIPTPFNKYSWTKYFTERYNKGYKGGFIDGYSQSRYKCLKK
jgi:flagellar biosynthesis/type III secretory pathway protein FliH